jgi:hypothetical protein
MLDLVHESEDAKQTRQREIKDEARGASQAGPFDYCPLMGFREYWYPAIKARKIGAKRPERVKMLGE